MPAVTLIAIALAGAVIAAAAPTAADGDAQSASAIRGASRRKIQTANAHTADVERDGDGQPHRAAHPSGPTATASPAR